MKTFLMLCPRAAKIRPALLRGASSSQPSASSWWDPFRSSHGKQIQGMPEFKAVQDLRQFFRVKEQQGGSTPPQTATRPTMVANTEDDYEHIMSSSDYLLSLDVAMATFSLHVHARVASLVGRGFYTIGPCGEELLSSAAMALTKEDSTALHYRHTAISLGRQWREKRNTNNKSDDSILDDLLLARARGYTVSKYDPVTGGVHCSIGGGPNEFVVTSTLSSQCPSAVGRALGYALQDTKLDEQQNKKPISFATLGDGSLHNHHFLSSLTLARHAKHLKIKCPMVFGISNNGLSISYETKNYVGTVFGAEDPLLPVFRANGQDLLSVYDQSQQACDYARHYQSPCVIIYTNLVRRFGHAATDRQSAYLDSSTIDAMADTCVLQSAMTQAVEQLNLTTYPELQDRWEEIHYSNTDRAFARAIQEPKVTLDDMVKKVSAPLANLPTKAQQDDLVTLVVQQGRQEENETPLPPKKEKPQVMRKHMTRVLDELLEQDSSVVYLGEDVRHGGYYLVTEGLAVKFPTRIIDFPPDETTLLGAALGFSQLGLLPIVEIPYAKYLDCGVDMFYEIAMQHWLTTPSSSSSEEEDTNKTENPKGGMIIRLQGFDRGVFGGNFHTHNMLSHMPPGIDVVCYSHGHDYVRGMRHAYHQAKAGRIVMLVDCTYLLNLRHVHDRDRGWEFSYPTKRSNSDGEEVVQDDLLGFDQVRLYKVSPGDGLEEKEEETTATTTRSFNMEHTKTAIVSYGNGVVASLQARKRLVDRGIFLQESDLDIVDCPFLSGLPLGLEEALQEYSMIMSLQERQSLPPNWSFVGAPRTYNPLGSPVTFLNCDMIEEAVIGLLQKNTTAVSTAPNDDTLA